MSYGDGSTRLLVLFALLVGAALPISVAAQTPRRPPVPDVYREIQRQRAIQDLYQIEMRRRQDQLRAIQRNDLQQFRDNLREEETLRRLRHELEADRLREFREQSR